MNAERRRPSHISLAACAVAMAAAVGGDRAVGSETAAVQQIERYCATSWRNAGIAPQDWSDCTQQALVKLLERVSRRGLPKALEARDSPERLELNRSIWSTIQRWRRAPRPFQLEGQDVSDGCLDSQFRSEDDRADELAEAFESLSPRQQKILALWSEGETIEAVARMLDLSTARTSDEKYKALRKLRKQLGIPC